MKRFSFALFIISFLLPASASAETCAEKNQQKTLDCECDQKVRQNIEPEKYPNMNPLYVDSLIHVTSGLPTLNFQLFAPYKFSNNLGVYGWVSVNSNNWAEAVAGFILRPRPSIEIGLAGGVEQAEDLWRFSSYLFMGNEQGYAFGMWEYGASGFSYKLEGNYRLLDWLGGGFFAQSDMGFGPRLQFNIPKKQVVFYGGPLFTAGQEECGGFIGLRFGL